MFAGQIILSSGALQLRFDSLPRDIELARDLVLQLLGGMLAWLNGLIYGVVVGVSELVVFARDKVVQVWLGVRGGSK